MSGEIKETDIIDKAMANDDYDYGDKPEVVEGEEGDEGSQPEPSQQRTQVEQPEQVDQRNNIPGRVPEVQPGSPTNGMKRVGPAFADGKGNIVDQNGKMIARSGGEARFWQEASRATAQVQNLTRQMEGLTRERAEMQQTVQQAREIAELPQKLGVSREDYNEGVSLMAKWRQNPVEVAREVVARTLTFGHNITDILGKSVGDSVDMKALRSLVDQTQAPIRQQQEQEARQQQLDRTSRNMYDKFVASHEYAETHGEAIANLVKNRGVAPEVAYLQVQNFALANGLDFTQPLSPQIAALQNGNGQNNTGRRQIPNGSGRGSDQVQSQPAMASADDDWASIIKGVMQQT